MHHNTILGLALGLLSTASAFVLPEGQANGVYKVRRTASGEEIHEAVNLAPRRRHGAHSAPAAAHHQLSKRSDWGQVYCGCGYGLDAGETDAAVADLKGQYGDEAIMAPDSSYYSIQGNTVAFVCNLDGNAPLKVWPDIIGEGLQQVTDACGLYVSGSTGGQFDFSMGYMQNNGGVDFCGNSLTSPVGSC